MEAEALAALDGIRWILAMVIALCLIYFAIPDEKTAAPRGRDFVREHQLGAHRQTPVAWCPKCREGLK